MAKITIPKQDYQKLVEKALRYEYIRQAMKEDLFISPPTRNVKKIIEEFKKTGRYNQKFLESLERGLRQSSHFRA